MVPELVTAFCVPVLMLNTMASVAAAPALNVPAFDSVSVPWPPNEKVQAAVQLEILNVPLLALVMESLPAPKLLAPDKDQVLEFVTVLAPVVAPRSKPPITVPVLAKLT